MLNFTKFLPAWFPVSLDELLHEKDGPLGSGKLFGEGIKRRNHQGQPFEQRAPGCLGYLLGMRSYPVI